MIFSLLPTVHLKIICLYNISPPRASSTYVEKKVKRTNRQDRYQIEKSICLVFWLDIHYKCKYHLQLLRICFCRGGSESEQGFFLKRKTMNNNQTFVCPSLSLFTLSLLSHTPPEAHSNVLSLSGKNRCV